MANLPFRFVESERARKYVSLQNTCANTLKKYMKALLRNVDLKLAKNLPNTFGIVIDGLSEGGTYFLAIFASFFGYLK